MISRLQYLIPAASLEAFLDSTATDRTSTLPSEFNQRSPLQLNIGRPVLQAILEDNIENIQTNLAEMDWDEHDAAVAQQMITTCQNLLDWVNQYPHINILVGLFPTSPQEIETGE